MSLATIPVSPVASIVAPPKKPISKEEILNEIKIKEQAEEAKAKPKDERTLGDKAAIARDFINSIPEPKVCHANGVGNKLNVLA